MDTKDKIRIYKEKQDRFEIKNGEIIIPDGYELYKVPTKAERIQTRISEIEAELKGMSKPTEQELIAEGRLMHPYFMMTDELEYLRKEIES